MSAPPLVVGIGEILWDLLPDGRQMGGAPANFAVHARALGASGVIVSAVGDDRPGREILEELGRRGLDRSGIAVLSGVPTGTVTVALDAAGIPRYTIHEGVAWDVIPWTAEIAGLAARADAVCFGSLAQRSPVSRAVIGAFLDATRPDCLRVLDLNLRQSYFSREVVRSLLERATVLKLNDEELTTVGGMLSLPGPEDRVLAGLLEAYPLTLIAVTKGPSGSRLFGRGVDLSTPGRPVETADTVGAGDAFTAALVMGMLRHRGWAEIGERANRVAAFVCSRKGAWPELPAEMADRAQP
ncbi:MAG TPA: carbohydrate kinase [Candidatus Aminicenantes bacterium]|nr:carbohydrate kinase [Candidatus Aminicenantes bacterium]HRY64575.1 carbohydrate kinase [Candidatus Aminicenantes bacterium]HRZ71488.1 carbohydrate kinase [Candidatus Aminicenantes bacterium]